jgi:hypothetical protein
VEERDDKSHAGETLVYARGPDGSHDLEKLRNNRLAGESACPTKQEDEPMLYCPVCSTRLAERKCKLFCERCGYYMSCADYY